MQVAQHLNLKRALTIKTARTFLVILLPIRNIGYHRSKNVAQHSDKTQRIRQSDALPGRGTPMPLARLHVVSQHSMTHVPDNMDVALFAMGCFWGVERLFWQQEGVYSTAAGYTGGFMMYTLRKIPKRTDYVRFAGYKFEVVDIDSYKIDQLLVTRLEEKSAASTAVADAELPAEPKS